MHVERRNGVEPRATFSITASFPGSGKTPSGSSGRRSARQHIDRHVFLVLDPEPAPIVTPATMATVVGIHDLAKGVLVGVLLPDLFFAGKIARLFRARSTLNEEESELRPIPQLHAQPFRDVIPRQVRLRSGPSGPNGILLPNQAGIWQIPARSILHQPRPMAGTVASILRALSAKVRSGFTGTLEQCRRVFQRYPDTPEQRNADGSPGKHRLGIEAARADAERTARTDTCRRGFGL